MQTQGGVAAETVITSSNRHFRARLQFDWDNNGLFAHYLSDLSRLATTISTDRALKGSAPEDVMIIEGSSAAELKVVVAGYDNTAALPFTAVFSPYNGLSPLYAKQQIGIEVKYDIGVDTALGTVWYPQFIGNITSITPDRGSGEVEIVALDRVEKLRKPVILAPWAVSDYYNGLGRTEAQKADTQVFIQNCLQNCDVSATRRRPTYRSELFVPDDALDGVGIFVPGAGGMNPSVGWIDNAGAQTYPTNDVPKYQLSAQPHPLSPDQAQKVFAFSAMGANSDGDYLKYWVANRDLTRVTGAHFMAFTMSTAAGFPNSNWHVTAPLTTMYEYRAGNGIVLSIQLQNNEVWVRVVNSNNGGVYDSSHTTIPSGQESVEIVGVVGIYTDATNTRGYIRAGSNQNVFGAFGPAIDPSSYPFDQLQGLLITRHRVATFDVAYAFRNFGMPTQPTEDSMWRQAKYAAVLDQGANSISFNPGVNGKDAWDVITDLAAAEFGSVFWDENGVFRFWNYNTVKNKQNTIVRTIGLKDLEGLEISNTLDSVRNIYSVQADRMSTVQTKVFEASAYDQFIIPAYTVRDFIIYDDSMQYVEPYRFQRYTACTTGPAAPPTFPAWNDQWSHHGYVMQLDYTPVGQGWHEPNYNNVVLDIYCFFNNDGQMVVRITNPWGETARLAVANGDGATARAENKGALRIDGTKILKGDTTTFRTADNDSVRKYGPRNYEATGDWYQQSYNDEGLLNVLIPRTSKPIPTTQDITMAGDPRIQLADTMALIDPDGFGEEMRVQVFGINRTLTSDGGLTDTLSVEMLRPAALGIWDSSQYGRWDQSLIWN